MARIGSFSVSRSSLSFLVGVDTETDLAEKHDWNGRGCGLSATVATVSFRQARVGGRYVAGTVLADWTRRSNFTSGAGRIESGAGQDPRILDRAAFELGVVAPGEKGDRPPHGADLHTRACPLRRNATTGRSAREQRA